MGSGASVDIHPPHITDKHFKELLNDKKQRSKLFTEISEYSNKNPSKERAHYKDHISLDTIVKYFTDTDNSHNKLYNDFHVNVDVLNVAYKFSLQQSNKKKKSKNDHKSTLTKKDFSLFLPTLFLFIKLYDIFDTADKLIVEDKRVFKSEFVRVKSVLNSIDGVEILGTLTDEQWAEEFDKLDKNKDGHIVFDEFCSYATQHIKRPFDYAEELEEYDDNEAAKEDGVASAPVDDAELSSSNDGRDASNTAANTSDAVTVEATPANDNVEVADTTPVTAEAVTAEATAASTTETAPTVDAEAVPVPVEA